MSESIGIPLRAKNSSGEQELSLSRDGEEFWFTLAGQYRGEAIQIDFDEMTREEVEDLKAMLEVVIEEKSSGQ